MQKYPQFAVEAAALIDEINAHKKEDKGRLTIPTEVWNVLYERTKNMREGMNLHDEFKFQQEVRRVKERFEIKQEVPS